MSTNERGHKIMLSEEYHPDGSYRPIFITLDDESYISILDDVNSYRTYFHSSEYDTYYNLLECAYDHEYYDEDEDEYCHPDELDLNEDEILWSFDIRFEKEYKGNWIIRDRIFKIEKAVQDFKDKYVKPLTIDDIKGMMLQPSELSLYRLMQIKKTLQVIKEAKDGAGTTV